MSRYRYPTPQADLAREALLYRQTREQLLKTMSPEEALKMARLKHAAAAINQQAREATMWSEIASDLERVARATARGEL